MIFDKTTILGSSTEYSYFGEAAYKHRAIQRLDVEGYLVDSVITSGDSTDIADAIDGFLGTSTIESVSINGTAFGSGKLTSISFSDEGESVNLKKVSASIEIYKPMGGASDFPTLQNPEWIESLTEDFQFDESSGSKSYSHSISVTYLDTETNDPLDLAQTLAGDLIDLGINESLVGGFDLSTYKSNGSEKIDEISKSYSISKQYSLAKEESNYDYDMTRSVVMGGNGITVTTESATVRGIKKSGAGDGDFISSAKAGADILIAASYTDHLTLANEQINDSDGVRAGYTLLNKKLSLSKTINEESGTVSYKITYSNDPAINQLYSWDYIHKISKSQGVYKVSESGNIVGDGKPFVSISNAKTAWGVISAGVESRIQSLYSSNSNDYRPIRGINESVSYSEMEGSISYNFEYSNDSADILGDITSKAIYSESFPVELKNNFSILRDGEMHQKLGMATAGGATLSLTLFGKADTKLSEYKAFIAASINEYKPEESDGRELLYPMSPTITFNPFNNSASFSIKWNWNTTQENI